MIAHLLTAARLVLAVPFALSYAREDRSYVAFEALAIAAAIITDLLDGPVARRRGTVSAWGGTFDHAADFVFVTGGLAAGAARGVFPWLLPSLVAAAFAQYVIDSYWFHRDRKLRASRLGRYNGILYFVPLCGDVLTRSGLGAVRPMLAPIVWMLVASTLVSMADRLTAVRTTSRRVPVSPGGETADGPPH